MGYALTQQKMTYRTTAMADHEHGKMDISVQEKTFDGFVNFTKWSIIAIIVTLVLMAMFLTF